jgi:C-terminal processing protease CtpA/Prc
MNQLTRGLLLTAMLFAPTAFAQTAKRGKIIGEQTAGVSNTVVYRFTLVDGTGVQMAVAKAFRQDGSPIPDVVTPDLELSWNYALLADEGRDNMVEAALETMK